MRGTRQTFSRPKNSGRVRGVRNTQKQCRNVRPGPPCPLQSLGDIRAVGTKILRFASGHALELNNSSYERFCIQTLDA